MSIHIRLFIFQISWMLSLWGVNQEAPQIAPVNKAILSAMQKNDIPGMAVALYYEGKGYLLSYGTANSNKEPITAQTIFDLASITKVFTTTDLTLQVQAGHMRLDDKLTKYLPRIDKSNGAINQITLKQLATHTSSLMRDMPQGKDIPFLQNWAPDYPIGTHFLYSNLGFGLLGRALQNATKTPYEELIARDILRPLGMTSTMTEVPAQLMSRYAQGYSQEGAPVTHRGKYALPGSGALRSTSTDMLRFLEANLGIDVPKPLNSAMQFAQKPLFKVNDHLTMGLGWQNFTNKGKLIIDKNGGVPGFSSYIGMLPHKKIGIVILVNKGKMNATQLGRNLLNQLSE